jgi:hypothetical protein
MEQLKLLKISWQEDQRMHPQFLFQQQRFPTLSLTTKNQIKNNCKDKSRLIKSYKIG